jgi:NitT/TauT family transport system permease protein
MRLTLMLLPFVVLIAAWFMGSAVRLEANPQDKLLPGLSQMVAAIDRMAFTPDKRSGEYLLWADTLISLSRLLTGLAVSSLIGLVIGIAAGVFPMYRAALSPLLTVVSMIPPLAILPVLFIVFGLDELSKVMLIVIGITPMLARDLEQRARDPRSCLLRRRPSAPIAGPGAAGGASPAAVAADHLCACCWARHGCS